LKLLTIHFFKCVAADLKLDIKIDWLTKSEVKTSLFFYCFN
jgi:hypothetical protein